MLERIDIGIEEAIAFRLGGKITEEEMTSGISIFSNLSFSNVKLGPHTGHALGWA